jgi:hypothetical protein
MWGKRNVVVLNKYGEYWSEVTVRRAINKILNLRATIVAEDKSHFLGTIVREDGPSIKYIPLYRPFVIQLKYFDYYKYTSDIVPYSDRQVFIRDKNICQYWHDYTLKLVDGKLVKEEAERHKYNVSLSERTIDHVIPVSKGGRKADYENVVCCCRYCNEVIKRDMTPKEAGLVLIKKPCAPHRVKGDIARNMFMYDPDKDSHKAYIIWKKESF